MSEVSICSQCGNEVESHSGYYDYGHKMSCGYGSSLYNAAHPEITFMSLEAAKQIVSTAKKQEWIEIK